MNENITATSDTRKLSNTFSTLVYTQIIKFIMYVMKVSYSFTDISYL